MNNDFNKNHFELFELPMLYAVDTEKLEHAYRDLQSSVHPDRFSAASDHERRLSMQRSTQVNEAFQTLNSPLERAQYLLSLNGVSTDEETDTAMPHEFLVKQLEFREQIGEAKQARDIPGLDDLRVELVGEITTLEGSLHEILDIRHDFAQGREVVRKLRFLYKLEDEIEDALEALEA